MNDTLNNNLKITTDVITEMMNKDKFDETKRNGLFNIINILTRSDEYIKLIKNAIKKINEDGKFDGKDIPSIIVIVSQSKDYISETIDESIELKTTLKLESLKYIIFGIIYFVLLVENTDQSMLIELNQYYSSLWSLIAFNPNSLLIKAKSLWKKCCH